MNPNNILKYSLRIGAGTILGIYLGMIVLLNIPYVQSRLSNWVSNELKKTLHTEISIGRVDIGMLNRIIIEDVLLHDQQNEELLNISRLSAKFEWLPLIKERVVINSIQLFGFSIQAKQKTQNTVPNYQFIVDALSSKDTLQSQSRLDLRINSILIRRGRMSYHVLSEPETPGCFNHHHLSIKDISATISLKALYRDSLNASIRRLSFNEEQSGFSLQRLSVKVLANKQKMGVHDFQLLLPNTTLQMDSLTITYDSLPDLFHLSDRIQYRGALAASITPQDLTSFVPALSNFDMPLNLQFDFSGTGHTLSCQRLQMNDDGGVFFSSTFLLDNWHSKNDTYFSGRFTTQSMTQDQLELLTHNLTGQSIPALENIEQFNLNAEITGYLRDLTIKGQLATDIGDIQADLKMNTDTTNMNRTYSGRIMGQQFSIGKLLDDEETFGKTDFDIELKGFNYTNQYPESYIKGIVSSFDYKGYQYKNIQMNGIYKDGGFNGNLTLEDKNGSIQIGGNFNAEQAIPVFNLTTVVKEFRPHDLHLSDRYEGADLSFTLTANFTGKSIDDINGRISLDSVQLNDLENGNYFLDHLTITAEHLNNKKEIRVESPFMSATVSGNYSYHTLPASIIQTMQHYIPSLVSIRDQHTEPHNNFRFDVRIEDAELMEKLLGIPLEIQMPATLNGYVDDHNKKLRIEGYFPAFNYNGTHYDSTVLLCENPADRFKCLLRSAILLKSGAMLNLAMEADARNDRLVTTINWGNNTNVTYGGKFITYTNFSKTEGNHPILKADIDIQPTQVILNDTIWKIHPSHIAIDSGKVFVDNFLFEHQDQHLRINGKLTNRENDSCCIDLKNIRLSYVLDIVQFDDVLFDGLVTGNVNIKSVLKDPAMQTNLKVKEFCLNHALLGFADIKGIWDKELGGIRLNTHIAETGLSTTKVTGYVSPKQKGLDLHIQADSTNIGFLQPFIDGIFSDLNGRVNGHVRLYGDFKHLDLEGKVRARMDAKVDALNTYFQVRDDSIYISSGSIDFRNFNIYDKEGHDGLVNGYLHHTKLKNLMYHFNIHGNNLLMYDTREIGNMTFYGKVYATGDVILNGGNNAMNVEASLTTGNNTTFTYVTGITTEATSNQFITFIDKTPKRLQDQVITDLYHPSNNNKEEKEEGPPMDLHINMLINTLPNANMRIIMDPVAGDNITARGTGTLQVNYFNKGDFRMFGNYTIDHGVYKLSMQDVIRKDFMLKSGGTVTFTGDPYQANLDLQAIYTVNSASLSDLISDPSRNQGTVKVNCLMNLTGNLESPDIKFDLELPTVREEDKELVRSLTSTEEQMNTQIIYLLGIGKFYTYDYTNNDQSSNATSSLAFSTLSGQLNNMLSQWMDNKNWNIGANLSTGEKGWTDVEAEAILSGRLLNNRLQINGNFGYKENVMANTNFVGDFEAIWLLTPNGDFRLRAYNQTNDRYFIKSTLTTQGIGLGYKKDFSKWDELFHWFLWRRKLKKDKDTHN